MLQCLRQWDRALVMMVNEMVYLLFVVLVGLFGCCCVFEEFVLVFGKMDSDAGG